jgi:hypothetical protein
MRWVLVFAACAAAAAAQVQSSLVLESSDSRLVQGFLWAKNQALAYAFEDDQVGPWYEAALPGREAFCMRDVAHQSTGAHALGLARHNRNMLRMFAENISESKDWCSFWEIDRYGRPAPVDYKSDAEFWYNLPANFDVLDCCYRVYVWTGDRIYLEDPVFLNFYDRTVADYVERWDLGLDRVMKRKRFLNIRGTFDPKKKFQFYRGDPSYDERREEFVLGVDLLAAQYAAYVAYARIQELRADPQAAQTYFRNAAEVKALVNSAWWDAKTQRFYSHLNKDFRLVGRAGSSLLYRGVVEDGPRLRGALDELLDRIKEHPSSSVEGQSHHAEILYRYGVPDVAYAQMMDLTREGRSRQEYPEVSYSVIGAIVTGTMGITVDPVSPFQAAEEGNFVDRVVRTLPALGGIAWAELHGLPVRANEITVRHESDGKTVFRNQKGPSLIWQAGLPGTFETLLVDGQPVKARVERGPLDRTTSWVRVTVGAGGAAAVETPRRAVSEGSNL